MVAGCSFIVSFIALCCCKFIGVEERRKHPCVTDAIMGRTCTCFHQKKCIPYQY